MKEIDTNTILGNGKIDIINEASENCFLVHDYKFLYVSLPSTLIE